MGGGGNGAGGVGGRVMHSEILDVMTQALVEDDVKQIRVAFETGAGMVWLKGILEDRYTNWQTADIIDEFQGRGLRLIAEKKKNEEVA